MPHVYLPADHDDADLVLAGAIAEALGSAELHVAWTERSGAGAPEIAAVMREPVNPWTEVLALLFQAVGELLRAVLRPKAPVPAPAPAAAPAEVVAVEEDALFAWLRAHPRPTGGPAA